MSRYIKIRSMDMVIDAASIIYARRIDDDDGRGERTEILFKNGKQITIRCNFSEFESALLGRRD